MIKMHARITAVFCVILLLMCSMIYQIYTINASNAIVGAAQAQGKYRLNIAKTRGVIYDRKYQPLVNREHRYIASVLPTPEAASALLRNVEEEQREALLAKLGDAQPFIFPLGKDSVYARGVDVFRVAERYGASPYAPHLIGYLAEGNIGVSGLEKAFDTHLTQAGGEISVVYQMDALGRMMDDRAIGVEQKTEAPVGGIVLTLDADIQQAAQKSLEDGCEKGAVVVMDVTNGDILAMASTPSFDPNHVAASLEEEDAPFLNRAISAYNIGSVFKLLIAAAALQSGVSPSFEYNCQGSINIHGQVFRCNNNAAHGITDMEHAFEVSCNGYFIRLAQEMEQESVLSLVDNMGLGHTVELAPGIQAASGNLPSLAEIQSPAGYANFSFGQGSSMASPLQMAQVIAAFANGGIAVTPRLVLGTTQNGVDLINASPSYAGKRVIREESAKALQEMMISVVEEGSGKPARPAVGSAGGKTSSAQTGQFEMVQTEDGEESVEIVHAWFAGFYPAKTPRYAIVVFVEGGRSGEQVAAPIFRQIADAIAKL